MAGPRQNSLKRLQLAVEVGGEFEVHLPVKLPREETAALLAWMTDQDIESPAAAIRLLIGASLTTFPTWGLRRAAMRIVMGTIRKTLMTRIVHALNELQVGIDDSERAVDTEESSKLMLEEWMKGDQ